MALHQRLDLKQGQALAMTPQLQQAIKLLQLSNLELSEFIETELEKNPLLERDGSSATEPSVESLEKSVDSPIENTNIPEIGVHSSDKKDENKSQEPELDTGDSIAEKEAIDETDYDYSTSTLSGVGAGGDMKFDNYKNGFENTLVANDTLRDHLLEQIHLDFPDKKDRAIATLMVDYLDESGYFRVPLKILADRLNCDIKHVEEILSKLQQLDPVGIFAQHLSECLALQLKDIDRLDPAMEKLLQNLDVLANHDMKKLRALCDVDDEDIKGMIDEIKALDPKPALNFEHFVPQTVIPDIFMKPLPKSKGGGWAVELNSDTLPRVLVNRTYYAKVSKTALAKKDKEYLAERLSTANWLVRAMDQRAQTILKVAGEIILQQEAFFNYGVEYLKPLVLKEVANIIGMHESTVSRVTNNKYIGTPRGVFELKYFFTSGVSNTDGSAGFSSKAIKSRLKTLLNAESTDAILSDDDLVNALRKEGITIARRTVAKYREAMKIPSSIQRRRLKKRDG
ncbi:MAG: RNA polymerase factor sigma-54 [Alphaproteobacteria bacterium]|nr:RNA polymerase factor sigma-54 [Alphaproteobacteria bacterium]